MTFKPNAKAPHSFRRQQRRSLNVIRIPDSVKRDLILESDKIFCGNFRALKTEVQAGRVSPEKSLHLKEWLVMASFRRNHVPLREAQRLAVA